MVPRPSTSSWRFPTRAPPPPSMRSARQPSSAPRGRSPAASAASRTGPASGTWRPTPRIPTTKAASRCWRPVPAWESPTPTWCRLSRGPAPTVSARWSPPTRSICRSSWSGRTCRCSPLPWMKTSGRSRSRCSRAGGIISASPASTWRAGARRLYWKRRGSRSWSRWRRGRGRPRMDPSRICPLNRPPKSGMR